MKSRKFFFLIIITFSACLLVVINNEVQSPYSNIIEKRPYSPRTSTSNNNKSIILMIGDGMGYEHLKLAKWVEVGKYGNLSIENLPFVNNVTTFSSDSLITDSAAAATAIATGYKTNNGYLSTLPNLRSVETILEISQKEGKSSGVISTTEITHATPAAFMTHVISRDQTNEIAAQIVEDSDVSIMMGGGRAYFTPDQLNLMQTKGYQFIVDNTGFLNISSGKVFGLFADGHLPYEINRNYSLTPSLANMTDKAIQLLSQDPDGFFLMVEGGRIDHAAHAHNKIRDALETIEFLNAVERAISFVKNTRNTLLIITADHETGGLKILSENLNNTLPSQDRTAEENEILRVKRAENVTVSWLTTGHTNANVPFYSIGIENDNLENFTVIDNTKIFDIMNAFISSESLEQTDNTLLVIVALVAIPVVPSVSFVLYKKLKTRRKKPN